MSKTSLKLVSQRCSTKLKNSLAPELETRDDTLKSPDIFDLLVWNIIVAYCVSNLSNATFHWAVEADKRIKEKGRLSKDDLEEIGIEEQFEFPAALNREKAVNKIADSLIEYGLDNDEAAKLADISFDVITKQLEDGNQ